MKKIFLDELPRKYGVGANKDKLVIDWLKSIGYNLKFIYDNVEGEILIVDFQKEKRNLKIEYNKIEYDIKYSELTNCNLGKILKKRTGEFKLDIGQVLNDNNRNLIITDRKKEIIKNLKYKLYKYKCNLCGFDSSKHYSRKDKKYKYELWTQENSLISGLSSCSCCQGNQIVVENINSIHKTDPWMIPYIGEECAKTHTYSSGDKITAYCPNCKNIKENIRIDHIYKYHSIGCPCSDSTSYPEKMMFSVLKQLEVDFQTQLNKTTFEWCKNYKYDFYLNDYNILIEVNGGQHYNDCTWGKEKDIKQNDKTKKELALKNGIKKENYIIIDCRYSELEFIKQNILVSRLNVLFDLNKVNWKQVEEFALSSRVKEACDLYNSGIHSTKKIGAIMKLSSGTVCSYLKKGKNLNWCDYDTNLHFFRTKEDVIIIEALKNEESLGIFQLNNDFEENSKSIIGIELNRQSILRVCNGIRKTYKGLVFKYILK